MKKAFINWSGGKDAAFSLYKVQQCAELNVTKLLTSVNATHDRISMHGVRRILLEAQARSIGIPLETIELPEEPGMEEYERIMLQKLKGLQDEDFMHCIFGDIFLEDLRVYREKKLAELRMEAHFPLWKSNTNELVKEFIGHGFQSVVVCVNEKFLDKSFCGRLIDDSFLRDLPPGVDPCGENGEYHSFVFEGPIFREPVFFARGEIVRKTYEAPKNMQGDFRPEPYGFYFCDLLPV